MRTPNPRQIEAFRALMLSGSTTAAAKMMNITQPAVSRLVRDLQYTLGLVLFERRGTRLIPTGEALSLYGEVERSFVGLERIARVASELRSRRAGVLRVAALPALANGFLPRFAGHFIAERPHLDLALFGLVSHLIVDWVKSGQCDLGFAEAHIEHAGVRVEPMPAVPMVAVMPAGHRLSARAVLRPADFAGETFISLGPSSRSRFRIDALFAEHGVERVLRMESPLSEIVCALVSSGVGVAVCDPFSAREFASRGVVSRPFRPQIPFQFAALHAEHRLLPDVAQEFVTAFRTHVEQLRDSA